MARYMQVWAFPSFSDNRGILSAVYSPITATPPASFQVGTTQVYFIVTNLYLLTATCQFTITVVDMEPPTIVSYV